MNAFVGPHRPWETYRTNCGFGRATFHPEWSPSRPWAIYVHGTARRHAATLDEAKGRLRDYGCRVTLPRH